MALIGIRLLVEPSYHLLSLCRGKSGKQLAVAVAVVVVLFSLC